MPRFHSRMEDGIKVSAASTYQDPRFSLDAGRFKDGVVWVKVKAKTGTGDPTLKVVSATEKDAADSAWRDVSGGGITLGAAGTSKPVTFSNHARHIRWLISSLGGATDVTFAADSYMHEE